jgi:hypothetical protein
MKEVSDGGGIMADKDKKRGKSMNPYGGYSSQNNLTYHFSPYGGSATFKDMKKRAEQAIVDHEFKA